MMHTATQPSSQRSSSSTTTPTADIRSQTSRTSLQNSEMHPLNMFQLLAPTIARFTLLLNSCGPKIAFHVENSLLPSHKDSSPRFGRKLQAVLSFFSQITRSTMSTPLNRYMMLQASFSVFRSHTVSITLRFHRLPCPIHCLSHPFTWLCSLSYPLQLRPISHRSCSLRLRDHIASLSDPLRLH